MKRQVRLLGNRMTRVLLPYHVAVAGVLVMHLSAAPAWAQRPARLPGDGQGWLPWGIAGGIIAITCILGFLNPKRSHLG